MSDFSLKRLKCGDITLNIAECGAGSPVIFLHGFPEHWRAFAPIMETLSDQFQCIAPDQRGYGFSDRPLSTQSYSIDCLADDIAALMDQMGLAKAYIVAHDWGGLVAWHFASRHAALLDRLIIFNAPHPYCLQHALNTDPAQRLASNYSARFSKKDAHIEISARTPESLWQSFFGADERAGKMSPAQKAAILEAWDQEGAWPAMLNWYQASDFDYQGETSTLRLLPAPIVAPTLLIWGDQDPIFTQSALDSHSDIVQNFTLKIVRGGGHAVFRDDPTHYGQMLRDFLLI